jgi:hypothetical protein
VNHSVVGEEVEPVLTADAVDAESVGLIGAITALAHYGAGRTSRQRDRIDPGRDGDGSRDIELGRITKVGIARRAIVEDAAVSPRASSPGLPGSSRA